MLYKSITLQMLTQRPEIHSRLRRSRTLLPALDTYASHLKSHHELWKERLTQARPGSDPKQIESEALEYALKELEDRLSSGYPGDSEPPSLDAAMEFIRRCTPTA